MSLSDDVKNLEASLGVVRRANLYGADLRGADLLGAYGRDDWADLVARGAVR